MRHLPRGNWHCWTISYYTLLVSVFIIIGRDACRGKFSVKRFDCVTLWAGPHFSSAWLILCYFDEKIFPFCRGSNPLIWCQRFSCYTVADIYYMCCILCGHLSIYCTWPVSTCSSRSDLRRTVVNKLLIFMINNYYWRIPDVVHNHSQYFKMANVFVV